MLLPSVPYIFHARFKFSKATRELRFSIGMFPHVLSVSFQYPMLQVWICIILLYMNRADCWILIEFENLHEQCNRTNFRQN